MPIKAWIHWVGENQNKTAHEVASHLTQMGIEVKGIDAYHACEHGVIFSDEVTPEICSQLYELSRNGQKQVLACCWRVLSGEAAWRLMAAGAADVLICAECGAAVSEISARLQRWDALEQMLQSPAVKNNMVGESQNLKAILRQVVEVAHFTDASVLIQGESGTGKELLAKLIHEMDSRPDKGDLIILDCSTIMPELSGSEFFGHERGAFTGAVSAREGAFALANGGTLFLDEIAELPLPMQAQLLRVIQEHTFKRVGGNTWQNTSFRLISATNLDLRRQVQRGVFRADLFYRIAGFVCQLPPLRERPEDILPLAHHFLKLCGNGQAPSSLDAPVQEYLISREYPGNVRDLKQVVTRLLCRYAGQGPITLGCIPPEDRPARTASWDPCFDAGFERAIRSALMRGMSLKTISRETEKTTIRIAVDETGGNLQRAAQRLGVTDRTLQMWRAAQRLDNKV